MSEKFCDLDMPFWSVISEHGVLEHRVTYRHAIRMQNHHFGVRTPNGFRLHSGITIVTADAAERLKCNNENANTESASATNRNASQTAAL